MSFDLDVVVVGGCGHVGLPLGIAFAERGLRVGLYDINEDAVEQVSGGRMPFYEPGASEALQRVIKHRLVATADPASISSAEQVVVVIGTPVDEHLNPDPNVVTHAVRDLAPYLRDEQLLVLRSTVFPGTTALVERTLAEAGLKTAVAFCPERIAEGKALEELYQLPQIVAGREPLHADRAAKLFGTLTSLIVRMSPEEAELAKLFANTWRYIKFGVANQLFMMAHDFGVDYEQVRAGLAQDYPRAADLPRAGFAAGPCLMKDTMQLAALSDNHFQLGWAAMMVNEGLPNYLVSRIEQHYDLAKMTIGILGMSFKGGSDDTRSSLSYKLKRLLRFKARAVLCHDPLVHHDPQLLPLEEVLKSSDLLIVGSPHEQYRQLSFSVPVIDIWGLTREISGL